MGASLTRLLGLCQRTRSSSKGPRHADLTELMLEENARFNAGLCCIDHRQGALQLEQALTLLRTIEEHPEADKQQVQLR